VGARLVAAGNETRLRLGNPLEGIRDLWRALDPGGVVLGTDDDEVVVHDEAAILHLPFPDVLPLDRRRVHERHISFSTGRQGQRLPRADGDGLDGQAGLLLEHGHEDVEQPRVLGPGGRGQDDVRGLRAGGGGQPHGAQRNEQQAKQHEASFGWSLLCSGEHT